MSPPTSHVGFYPHYISSLFGTGPGFARDLHGVACYNRRTDGHIKRGVLILLKSPSW